MPLNKEPKLYLPLNKEPKLYLFKDVSQRETFLIIPFLLILSSTCIYREHHILFICNTNFYIHKI